MENMELIIFEIISNGGNAKALVYDAMVASEKGNFVEAKNLLKEADEYLTIAHQTQTNLIHEEANGIHHDVSVLFVHAQDHLMTAIEVRSLAENVIRMNKRLYDLEQLVNKG